MKYKYNKKQLIGKKLEVPKRILEKIYQCTLSFPEWIEYDLVDKIPITCLLEEDQKIVEKFHIEKAKTLDWELLNKRITDTNVHIKELVLKIDSSKEDLNGELYELVKNHINPNDYSSLMKEKYQERILEEHTFSNDFNKGNISLEKIVTHWDTFKDKDLTNCLLKDEQNTTHLTNEEVKDFMSNYEDLAPLIVNHNNVYSFLTGFKDLSEDEKTRRIKRLADDMILYPETNISNEEAKILSKYIPILDYLKIIDEEEADKLIKELETLNTNYLYDSPIPFYQMLSYSVLKFISTYGLKNIVEFDQECGHFFTKNDCKMLKDMYNLYLYYGGNKQDPNKTFYIKPLSEKRPYSKDEFYEAMKRMIMNGPTNLNRLNEAPDYREMTGEFKRRNQELFLEEDAPQELKKLFYTKRITPQLLLDKKEYISYLKNKKLSSCMEDKTIRLEEDSSLINIYDLIQKNNDFDHTIKFITDYCDILDLLLKRNNIKLGKEDNLEEIKNKIDHYFIRLLITKRIPFPKNIPYEFIEKYPSLFLNSNASKEIKEAYYDRTINSNTILSHKEDKMYLKKINPEVLFSYVPVHFKKDQKQVNLIKLIEDAYKEDSYEILIQYIKYIELMNTVHKNIVLNWEVDQPKEELLDEIDKEIYKAIVLGHIKYQEDMPDHFKKKFPTLFLDDTANPNLKDKFYNRRMTLNDIKEIELLDTNLIAGMSEEYSWLIPLFRRLENEQLANYNRLKVLVEFNKIEDHQLEEIFKEHVKKLYDGIDINTFIESANILSNLSHSTSKEIYELRESIANQILESNNPQEKLNQIENIFKYNHVPTVGKIYSCFEILHPNIHEYDTKETISPVLQRSSPYERKYIIFQDLIKASLGSNNQSMKDYLDNIEQGTNIYYELENNKNYEDLSEEEKEELKTYIKHLITLYNQTDKGKQIPFYTSGNELEDINELVLLLSPNGTKDYKIENRIISMFCSLAGIRSLKEIKDYMKYKIEDRELKNRIAAKQKLELSIGDYIKGIGDITYLPIILQNGCIANDFLISNSKSDATPLDVDLGRVTTSYGTIKDKINLSCARNYGPIWIILKNDERFYETRNNIREIDNRRDLSKLEVFSTGVAGKDHYGIRTGFASSEIDYIVVDEYNPKIGLEIVKNGFYIPVSDKEGNIVFTPEDYDQLKGKISKVEILEEKNNYYK